MFGFLSSSDVQASRSAEKRIVLHSEPDILRVIANLTKELASLTGAFESLKKGYAIQITELQNNLTDIKNENANKNSQIQSLMDIIALLQKTTSPGSSYVRWGRNSCPGNGTETVYTGFAAGSFYSTQGGGANHLCLSPDPVWAHYTDTEESSASIYGTEYQFWDHRNNLAPFFGHSGLLDKDVPCSVCRSTRSRVIMVPGRNICYAGWTLEYKGYLVAGYDGTPKSDYICLDDRPDSEFGGQSNQDGTILNFVQAKCGSLKCPPYVDNRELTCAVCSK